MPPAPTMGWMCEKGARLSPPGSCSAAWRVPCGEEEGLGGDGALRKISANPCHFLGLVTGVGWRAMARRETREGPDIGSDQGWTQPGQATAPREEAGCQRPGCPREVSRCRDQDNLVRSRCCCTERNRAFLGVKCKDRGPRTRGCRVIIASILLRAP